MTSIQKLKLHGFKSFPKATEITFPLGYSSIIGSNGSGKCTKGDSLVQLSDGSLTKIEDLVNSRLESQSIKMDDGFMSISNGLKVSCLNMKTLKVDYKEVKAYVKRESPEHLLTIKTKSGRSITATEYHPLFVLKDNEVKPVRADELKEGVRVAVPRIIKIEKKEEYFYEIIDKIELKDNVYVPYHEGFRDILKSLKHNKKWKNLAKDIGIDYNTLKGLLDKQSINFYDLIKILRFANKNNKEIIELIPEVKAKFQNIAVKIPWKNSKEFSRFLGYLLAEGRLPSNSDQIWFTNGTQEIVEDYEKLCKKLFGIKVSVNEYKAGCWDILMYSHALRIILTKFGMSRGRTEDKEITNLYLKHSSDEELYELINGLYCGDGYVSKRSIEITTKSKKLAVSIENILTRLGFLHNSKFQVKIAANSGYSGIYKTIKIYGVNNFKLFNENIKLIHNEKKKRVENLLNVKSNPNLDVIEINNFVKKVTKNLKINIKETSKEYSRLKAYVYNQCLPTKEGLSILNDNLLFNEEICTLVNSDIYWDEVILVERIKSKEKWVYDLCVDEDHNFIANGIFVHNSNVMDAFCFVFGKGSAKGLRAEKSANLIYNGGKEGKPMKEAEVSIWFDNKDKEFPISEKQLKISRIVRQNGQSVYKINDKTRNRQEILDLLNAARIDPDGHNIILQGDIVKFMELKPDQRRQVMEEISGISVYEDKKQKAMNDLDKVEARLKEAEIILTERKAHLRELKNDRDQALRYKEVENSIKSNRATYVHLQIKNKLSSREDIDKRIKEQESMIKKIQDSIDTIKGSINEKKNEIKSINEEIEKRGEKEQLKLHKEVEGLKTSLLKKESRSEICSNEIKRSSSRKDELRKEHAEIEEKIKDLKKTIEQYEKSKKDLEADEQSLIKEIGNFKEKHNIKDIDGIRDKLDGLNSEKNELIRRKDKIEFELSKFSEGDFKDITNLRNEFKAITADLNSCLKNDDKYIVELSRLRKKLVEKNEDIAKLNVQDANYRQMTFDSIAIKRILDSGIKGVHNLVSELGRVDKKYSLALEVAAGARLKSIVVDDDQVAQKCINYLKEKRLGVCTFLPLNKIRGMSLKDDGVSKGVYGSAVNLVRFDHEYKNVFNYVFGSTLIVEDIETARNIGIGKSRMVTLSGDLLELSGAMIGGHRQRSNYSFKEVNFDDKIGKMELEISQLKKQVDDYENLKVNNDNKIYDMKKRKGDLEGQLIKFGKLFDNSTSKIDLDKGLKEINGKLVILEKEILKCSTSLQESKQDSISGLDALGDKKSRVKEKIIHLDSSIKNFSMQISSILIPEKEKIISIIRNHDREIHEFNEELILLSKEIKEISVELKGKEKLEKDFYNEFRSLFNKRNKVQELIQGKETSLIKEEEKIRSAQQRVNAISLDRAKLIAETEALEKEFEPLRNEKIKKNINFDEIKFEIQRLEREFQKFGNVNLRALEIYEELEKEFNKLTEKHDNLKVEREDVISMMNEIDGKKKDLFMKTFSAINKKFMDTFISLSDKGQAYMELEDEENPLENGIDIKVKLPGNRFMDIKSLSGGEKTMATLAFIFSIQEFQPASFYLLDEVDAALDKHNSMRLSKLIKQYSNKAQYIVISHNDQLITEADQIYGVSMQQGISKIVSLKI